MFKRQLLDKETEQAIINVINAMTYRFDKLDEAVGSLSKELGILKEELEKVKVEPKTVINNYHYKKQLMPQIAPLPYPSTPINPSPSQPWWQPLIVCSKDSTAAASNERAI